MCIAVYVFIHMLVFEYVCIFHICVCIYISIHTGRDMLQLSKTELSVALRPVPPHMYSILPNDTMQIHKPEASPPLSPIPSQLGG